MGIFNDISDFVEGSASIVTKPLGVAGRSVKNLMKDITEAVEGESESERLDRLKKTNELQDLAKNDKK